MKFSINTIIFILGLGIILINFIILSRASYNPNKNNNVDWKLIPLVAGGTWWGWVAASPIVS